MTLSPPLASLRAASPAMNQSRATSTTRIEHCSNTPIDVIKTRMQGLSAHKYSSVWDCAVQIATKEGALQLERYDLTRCASSVLHDSGLRSPSAVP